MPDDLKPCPFCGKKHEGGLIPIDEAYWYVRCKACRAQGPPVHDPDEAYKLWNTRAEVNDG